MSQRADLPIAPHSIASTDGAGASPPDPGPSRASAIDVFGAVVGALLPLAILSDTYSGPFVPKLAVLALILGVGLPLLVHLAVRSPQAAPARAALAFLAIGLVSAAASRSVLTGFFGLYLWGTGWLFWCGALSAWALGASLSARGRRLFSGGLLIGATLNSAVAIWQASTNPSSQVFGLYQNSQADGFLGNPIYLEALILGALAIALTRCCDGDLRFAAVGALLSVGLELSGERLAIVGLALLIGWILLRHRTRAGLVFAAAMAAGYALGYLAWNSTLLHDRLTTVNNTVSSPRFSLWKAAAHSVLHHLLLGVGPGQFRTAYTAVEPLALARRIGPGNYFVDAHDVFIEVVTTTGVLGLAAFCAFIGLALRRTRGPLLGFGLLALGVELIEPLNVAITPLALMAFGAASVVAPQWSRGRRTVLALRSLLCVAAAAVAIDILAGDIELSSAAQRFDYHGVVRADGLLRVWADPAAEAATIATYESDTAAGGPSSTVYRSDLQRAEQWRLVAVARDSTNPELAVAAGDTAAQLGEVARSRNYYLQALGDDRYATHALVGLGVLDMSAHKWQLAIRYFRQALSTAPNFRQAEDDLRSAEAHRVSTPPLR